MSRIDDIDNLIKLSREMGAEIIVSKFSDEELYTAGIVLSSAFSLICGGRSWWRISLLGLVGGFLFRKCYAKYLVKTPKFKTSLSEFLKENLSENEQKQLCSRMRLLFKNVDVFQRSNTLSTTSEFLGVTLSNHCLWNVERQKQQVIEEILEFVKQKYNIIDVSV